MYQKYSLVKYQKNSFLKYSMNFFWKCTKKNLPKKYEFNFLYKILGLILVFHNGVLLIKIIMKKLENNLRGSYNL